MSETNGVGSSVPFLKTRIWPPCCEMKIRPSGARCMDVGLERPVTRDVVVRLAVTTSSAPRSEPAPQGRTFSSMSLVAFASAGPLSMAGEPALRW